MSFRELLAKCGHELKDVRVDDDMSTMGWLHRATGKDDLIELLIGSRCCGGFEDVRATISDGTFEQALSGDLDPPSHEEMDRLKEE